MEALPVDKEPFFNVIDAATRCWSTIPRFRGRRTGNTATLKEFVCLLRKGGGTVSSSFILENFALIKPSSLNLVVSKSCGLQNVCIDKSNLREAKEDRQLRQFYYVYDGISVSHFDAHFCSRLLVAPLFAIL